MQSQFLKNNTRWLLTLATALTVFSTATSTSFAQTKTASEGIDEYRAMLADGNPAELYEAKGEELWKKARGPKNASLEKCDLGQGPGVVKGAFVTLPRFFADTKKVQDLESRLMTCMEELQGIAAADIIKTPFNKGEQNNMASLVAYISAESRGMAFNLPNKHAQEKEMYAVGKSLFFMRAGPYDFSCATCHGSDGKRIRLQDLPNITKNEGAGKGFGAWPAYRVSNSQMWGMQFRLNDCYRQQRFPEPIYGSDATIALSTFMGVTAKGAKSIAPALKR